MSSCHPATSKSTFYQPSPFKGYPVREIEVKISYSFQFCQLHWFNSSKLLNFYFTSGKNFILKKSRQIFSKVYKPHFQNPHEKYISKTNCYSRKDV